MSADNALEKLADELRSFARPLNEAVTSRLAFDRFLFAMGWQVIGLDVEATRAAVEALLAAVRELGDKGSFDSLSGVVSALSSLGKLVPAVKSFADSVAAAAGDPGATAQVLGAFAADLNQYLSIVWIGRKSPAWFGALRLLGLIEVKVPIAIATAGPDPVLRRVAVPRLEFSLENISSLLQDPVAYLRGRLGIRRLDTQADAEAVLKSLFGPIQDLVLLAGGRGSLSEDPAPAGAAPSDRRSIGLYLPLPEPSGSSDPLRIYATLIAELVPDGVASRMADSGPGVLLEPGGGVNADIQLPSSVLRLSATAGLGSVFFAEDGPVIHATSTEGVRVGLEFATLAAEDKPAIVIGADALGLTIGEVRARGEARFGRVDDPGLAVDLGAAASKASFRIKPAEGDGFLGKVLPPDGLHFDFDLGIGWATRRGLYFEGGASLETDLDLHASLLGVLTIDVVHLRLGADKEKVALQVAATASLKLGPLSATVRRVGLGADALFRPGGGNVGPLEIRPAFVPPTGVGLSIKAPGISGAGLIINEPDKGRYGGFLQLKISDILDLTAIGLITTKLPDGSRGFSLLIIIAAEFQPVQLGFGFNLSGVGGLLGLNRTMSVEALRDGARSGVLDSILFPVDPVARATKVISDIEAVFPVAPGRFVIGLMARIGWGSPRLITIDLGLAFELPMPLRIALLGRIGALLPKDDAVIIELHLDIVGIIDLGRSELSIDASLHDSRVAIFEISGDMALRLCWGASPVFLVSVGGLNPRFERPPSVPELRRLTIALATGPNPSVRLESYFAITSNSLQLGALLSAHAEFNAGPFGVFSADAWLGFDALILIPFEFFVDITGGVMIKHNGKPFLGAQLVLALSGPKPFRAKGFAEVVFLGTHRIPIDVTVGERELIALADAIDPTGALADAIRRIESWSAQPPRGAVGVTTRKMPELEGEPPGPVLRAHPMGELTLKQRAVPLDVVIERFGGAPIVGGPRAFAIKYKFAAATQDPSADAAVSPAGLRDSWAPNDYYNLSDDEKITRPSFEQLPCGHQGIGGLGAAAGPERLGSDADFATLVIDEDEVSAGEAEAYRPSEGVEALLARLDASYAERGFAVATDREVTLAPQAFAIAGTAKLEAVGGPHPSWIEARAALQPGQQVVGAHEVAA